MSPVVGFTPHLAVLPVVLPLLVGSLLLPIARPAERVAPLLGLASLLAVLAMAVVLVGHADSSAVLLYQLGNWPAPFGISLVVDRLAALLLVVSTLAAIACQLAARGASSPRFPALLQLQVAGLNGAFLTGDLFNLFVCFEVLLAASYALLLDSQNTPRLRAGLHYVAINLLGSSLFLIAAALFYGIAGTLNIADLAARLPLLEPNDLPLARVAGLLLLVVFAIKAAALPLGLWLPGTYGAAPAHVAALFAIMTKVGIYAIARVHGTLFAPDADAPLAALDGLTGPWLLAAGLATLAFGALGALAARDLRTLVAWLVVGSAGTLLTALGVGTTTGIAAALYYLPHSTFAAGALFLIVELIARSRGAAAASTQYLVDAHVPVDSSRAALLGTLFFVAALFAAGLPPGPGFIGKALLLDAALAQPQFGWIWAPVLGAGLITLLALVRAASAVFWKPAGLPAPAMRMAAPPSFGGLLPATAWLLGAALLLALFARPVHLFALQAAGALGGT
jgi:multicomponent K+:H+ antiporter subunit D